MDITLLPFNKFLQITNAKEHEDLLALELKDNMKNHLGTFHASAQFALAEACSGLSLQKSFPHLVSSAVPVLRKAEIKFKQAAKSDIYAKSNLADTEKKSFENQFDKKGRASITVPIQVIDASGSITMVGNFEWFVQKSPDVP